MCAINPVHKKRILLDIYTADSSMTKEEFENIIIYKALAIEELLNESTHLRWHIKETEQEAE